LWNFINIYARTRSKKNTDKLIFKNYFVIVDLKNLTILFPTYPKCSCLYFSTALFPIAVALWERMPGRTRRTAEWISSHLSLDPLVWITRFEASLAMRDRMSFVKSPMMQQASRLRAKWGLTLRLTFCMELSKGPVFCCQFFGFFSTRWYLWPYLLR